MQLFGLFICTQSSLHVSGNVFAHHQEHLTVFSSSGIVHLRCCRPVSWTRWKSLSSISWPISFMTRAGRNIGGLYQKLQIQSSATDDGRKHRLKHEEMIGYKEIDQKSQFWSSITNCANDARTHKHINTGCFTTRGHYCRRCFPRSL